MKGVSLVCILLVAHFCVSVLGLLSKTSRLLGLLSARHSAELHLNPSYSFTTPLIAGCAVMWSEQIQQKEDESCLPKSLLQICLNFKFTSEVSFPKPLARPFRLGSRYFRPGKNEGIFLPSQWSLKMRNRYLFCLLTLRFSCVFEL